MPHQSKAPPPQCMVGDVLDTLKYVVGCYSERTLESATPAVRERFAEIWHQHQSSAYDMFQMLHDRGWYPVQPASPQKTDTALQTARQLSHGLFPGGDLPSHPPLQPGAHAPASPS